MFRKVQKKIYAIKKKFVFYKQVLKEGNLYRLSKRKYQKDFPGATPLFNGSKFLGVQVVLPHETNSLLDVPDTFKDVISVMYKDVLEKFSNPKNCYFETGDKILNKTLDHKKDTYLKTEDVPELKEGMVRNIKLDNCERVESLSSFCNMILPQVERKIYGSYVSIENIQVMRHPICHVAEKSSTMWHTDHHHDVAMKIILYFNDIGERNAPFEYLRNKKTKESVRVKATVPPKYENSRVPKEVVEEYLQNGYETHKVTAPGGTLLLFDDKVIHKGNYATEGFRDTLTLQLTSSPKKAEDYIEAYIQKKSI